MVDVGKMCALYKAGWEDFLIAGEMDMEEWEVKEILNHEFVNYEEGNFNVNDKYRVEVLHT